MNIPIIGQKRDFEVFRHLSGGTRIKFGREEIVLSPNDTKELAVQLLKAVGIDVKFDESMSRLDA